MPRPSIAGMLDSQIEIWRPTVVKDAIGVEERVYTLIETVDAFINRPREPVVPVGGGDAPSGGTRWYGLPTIDVQVRDVCKVVSGPDEGRTFEVNEPPTRPKFHHTEVDCIEWNGDIALITVPPPVIPEPIVAMLPTDGLIHDWSPLDSPDATALVDVVGGVNAVVQGVAPIKRGKWFDIGGRAGGMRVAALPMPDSFSELGVVLLTPKALVNATQMLWGYDSDAARAPAGRGINLATRLYIGTFNSFAAISTGHGGASIGAQVYDPFLLMKTSGIALTIGRVKTLTQERIYINGKLMAFHDLSADPFLEKASTGFNFGWYPSPSQPLFGAVGRVRQWNRVLTDDEFVAAHMYVREHDYPEVHDVGTFTLPTEDTFVTDGLTQDWNPADQSDATRLKDTIGGGVFDMIFGSVPPVFELNPPMLKFPAGAPNANTYAKTATDAVPHTEEYSVMFNARIDASMAGKFPWLYVEDAQSGTQKITDRISLSNPGDPTMFTVGATTSPGTAVNAPIGEAPAYPVYVSVAMVWKRGTLSLYIDGVLAASSTDRGYRRDNVAAFATVALGLFPSVPTSGIWISETAIGRVLRYGARALSAAEIAQNHNALRNTYPLLSRIW